MSQLDPKKTASSLMKKGFKEHNSKHRFFIYYFNGKKQGIKTMISHASDPMGDPLIKKMADQTALSKDQFMDLVECSLSAERYEGILKAKGLI